MLNFNNLQSPAFISTYSSLLKTSEYLTSERDRNGLNSFWFGEKLFPIARVAQAQTAGYVFGSSLKKKSLTESRVFTYDLTDRVGIHMSVGMCIITGSVGAHC